MPEGFQLVLLLSLVSWLLSLAMVILIIATAVKGAPVLPRAFYLTALFLGVGLCAIWFLWLVPRAAQAVGGIGFPIWVIVGPLFLAFLAGIVGFAGLASPWRCLALVPSALAGYALVTLFGGEFFGKL